MDDRLLGALAEARALGFLGPGPLEAHVSSADAFAVALGEIDGLALDLGSGGGVPGLLLADRYAEVPWVLVDQHRRRTSFLARVVAALGWAGRVEVIRAAAEELAHEPGHRARYAAVVARSFGPPALTSEIASGFLTVGGRLAVAEPPAPDPGHWPPSPLSELGFRRSSPDGASVAVLLSLGGPAWAPRPWRTMQRSPAWVVSRGTSPGSAPGDTGR